MIERLRVLSPRTVLVLGWLGFLAYAYPGYLSYDSVLQLLEARTGEYAGAHPPMMSVLWGITDAVIAGPFGMLAIQSTCFLAGAYLVLAGAMAPRRAAVCAVLVLWFPPVSAVLAVIWKDSQMAAYLVLGTALLLSPRRGVRLAGLGLLGLATAMRYNALAVTLPLVVLLFIWSPAHRWWKRYAIAIAAWLAITVAAGWVNSALARDRIYPWHQSLALIDIVGTLRYAPDLSDDRLRAELAGTPMRIASRIQETARGAHRPEDLDERTVMTFGTGDYVPALWVTTFHVFETPTTEAQRAAVARAWRAIVLGHPGAYLAYRWQVFRERIHLGDRAIPSGAYVWFTDVLDIGGSVEKTGHNARPSRLQGRLQEAMLWLGTSWMFRPYVYLAILVAVTLLAFRHREILALALSGLANEALLFVLAPTIDYRYSIWLVVATLLVVMMLIARRAAARAATLLE